MLSIFCVSQGRATFLSHTDIMLIDYTCANQKLHYKCTHNIIQVALRFFLKMYAVAN